eukprot:4115205-Prymnesium_polylepis.1
MTVVAYFCWKLLLRSRVGQAPDARGWGLETYLSAAIHQLATTLFAIHLITANVDTFSEWLASTWDTDATELPPQQRVDRFFFLMQLSEMLTDVCMHSHCAPRDPKLDAPHATPARRGGACHGRPNKNKC